MPPRPAIFRFDTRNFICQSCLSALRKRSTITTAPWPIRQSSQAAHAPAPSQTARRSPEQDAERLKTLKTLGLLKDAPEKPIVNYFEQGEDGKIRPIQDENEFSKALADPGGELDARLQELEDHLQGVTEIVKAIEKMGGKEEAEKLRRQFSLDSNGNANDLPGETEDQWISSLAIPTNGLVTHRQNRLHRLNNWIRRCARARRGKDVLPKDVQGLWKAYSAVRTTMSERWHTVPTATWEVLWQTLSSEHASNTNRMSHIYILAKDMQQSGAPLRPEQQVLALEAMFNDGWENEAIENHRRHVSTLGANPETFVAFWKLGLEMYCRVGDLERAERVASTILESHYETDPRFVQPLIKLCAETPTAIETGFKLYRDLRARLGDSMTIEDYDKIIAFFLASGNTERALFIFVDMMKSGSVDLAGGQSYPPSIANPFFFGKWLKRLIGTGDLEGTLNVLHFMISQGIIPHAIHVNGLIGAWLRSGTDDGVQKAEDIAWGMINTRIRFVEIRRRKSSCPDVNLYAHGDGWPRATLETFCLLAENYKERGLTAKMAPLWEALQEAEITPDSFMSNQLLFSLLQDGDIESVLPTYREIFQQSDQEPDSHTFMALWQALPANRFIRIQPQDLGTEISRTRALFAEMIQHASVFRSKDGMKVDGFLARKILHTFRRLEDHAGLFLAYRALRRIANYNPSDMVVFEMIIGTLDVEKLAQRNDVLKLIAVRAKLDHHLTNRYRELVASGEVESGEDLSLEMTAEETGNFLELHLKDVFSEIAAEDAQELAIEAAKEMGLRT
ncbi:hypothetical protein O1611_g5584 [Lasiodiplodia mahajangana]|uniref:Uncharacterized protein n=1 Tax=Lasiodiplodia mahajangana TaxID=1108764 RepID=A0ACC2JLB6_9PEZI|nr:hypothetical protein O1611_g5584 [Lasiodiplodia mahajangana]